MSQHKPAWGLACCSQIMVVFLIGQLHLRGWEVRGEFLACRVVLPAYGAGPYLPAIVMERPVYVREMSDGLYSPLTYLLYKVRPAAEPLLSHHCSSRMTGRQGSSQGALPCKAPRRALRPYQFLAVGGADD